jgi:hypothetical protein
MLAIIRKTNKITFEFYCDFLIPEFEHNITPTPIRRLLIRVQHGSNRRVLPRAW